MTTSLPVAPRTWARFLIDEEPRASELPPDSRTTRYVVDEVKSVRGAPLEGVARAARVTRVESASALVGGRGSFSGVVQHVLYTEASEKRELAASSAAESGPVAVLIPITKRSEWWLLAQDERRRSFIGLPSGRGHLAIGAYYAPRIFRRLYHSRYLPGATWDFLTYFEFSREDTPVFDELLAELRDVAQNPEWAYVDREAEIWMTKR